MERLKYSRMLAQICSTLIIDSEPLKYNRKIYQ